MWTQTTFYLVLLMMGGSGDKVFFRGWRWCCLCFLPGLDSLLILLLELVSWWDGGKEAAMGCLIDLTGEPIDRA